MFKNPKLITVVVVAILFLIFLMQNTQMVTLRLYFWKIAMSQVILILLVMLIGFVIGYVLKNWKKKKRFKQQ